MLKIGTSGFRGIDGLEINEIVCQKIAMATVNILEKNRLKKEVFLGYDFRENSKKYATEMYKILHMYGINCRFFKKEVTSSFVSYLCKKKNLDLSLMVTASHNPYTYNGVKIFSSYGLDLSEKLEKQYNDEINSVKIPSEIEKIEVEYCQEQENLEDEYIADICGALTNYKTNIRVAFDTMHGSSGSLVQKLIDRLNLDCKVIDSMCLAGKTFDAPIPSKENLFLHKELIESKNLDFSFATDGDGDRMAVITRDGKYHEASEVSPFLYYFAIKQKGQKGAFVGNYSLSTLGKKVCEKTNSQYIESKIGFKNIGKNMHDVCAIFGCENSSLAFSPVSLFKDGIVAFALLCEAVSFYNRPLEVLLKEFKKEMGYNLNYKEYSYHFDLLKRKIDESNVLSCLNMTSFSPTILKENVIDTGTLDGYKYFYPSSTLLIRQSGTERVIRIVIESVFDTEEILKEVLEKFSSFTKDKIVLNY